MSSKLNISDFIHSITLEMFVYAYGVKYNYKVVEML